MLVAAVTVATTATLAVPSWQSSKDLIPTLTGQPQVLSLTVQDDDQPFERQLGSAVRSMFRELRRYLHLLSIIAARALGWWGKWIKRSLFYVAVAFMAAIADGSLLNAFRQDGVRTLTTYVPMMLYVYTRLLFSAGVKLAPKLVLIGTIIYGAVWRDLIPDRRWIPGRVDDILLIVIAARAFVYACPEELVNQYAERAVVLRRRVASFQRARQR